MGNQSYKETFWCWDYVLHSPLQPDFSNSKTSSGHHCCLQVLWFGATETIPGAGLCFIPCSKLPFNPGVLLLSMEASHPPVNQVFPSLGMRPWSCVAAYPTWTVLFACACCVTEEIRSIFQTWKIGLFHCSPGEVCQQLYKNGLKLSLAKYASGKGPQLRNWVYSGATTAGLEQVANYAFSSQM